MNITKNIAGTGVCQYTRGRWSDARGAVVISEPPPPVPTLVYSADYASLPVALALGEKGFMLTLENGQAVVDDVILWICKSAPQKNQLDELLQNRPNATVLQIDGRFSENDLRSMITAYKPILVMAVLGATELSFLREIFSGELLRAEMSALGGMPSHQRFLSYEQIKVSEWHG